LEVVPVLLPEVLSLVPRLPSNPKVTLTCHISLGMTDMMRVASSAVSEASSAISSVVSVASSAAASASGGAASAGGSAAASATGAPTTSGSDNVRYTGVFFALIAVVVGMLAL
jgi:hypothetical protein